VGAGRLTAHVGRLGTGKSYTAAANVLKGVKAGRRQVTSFDIAIPRQYWSADYGDGEWSDRLNERTGETVEVFRPALVSTFDGWEGMLEVEDADITVDEAHLYAPSWDSKALPAPARWYLSHLRKLGVSMTWVSQHEDRTAKTLRDLTNEVVVHEVFFFGAMWFVGKHYEPENVRKKGKHTWRSVNRFRMGVAAAYDTLECSEFTGLTNELDVELVAELAERRNRGIPLAGASQAVRERWEAVARAGDATPIGAPPGARSSGASAGDGLHIPPPLLARQRRLPKVDIGAPVVGADGP
jgi:hypothetical protein